MITRRDIALAAGLLPLTLAAGYFLRATMDAPSSDAVSTAREAGTNTVTTQSNDDLRDQLKELTEDVAALRSEHAARAAGAARPSREAETGSDPEPSAQPPAVAVSKERQAELHRAQLARYAEVFESEESSTTHVEHRLLSELLPPGSSLQGLECATTMCRFQATHSHVDSHRTLVQALMDRGPRFGGTAVLVDGRTEVYLAKQGHTLPLLPDVD